MFWVCWLPFEPHPQDKKSGREWHPFHNVQKTHMMRTRMEDGDWCIVVELLAAHPAVLPTNTTMPSKTPKEQGPGTAQRQAYRPRPPPHPEGEAPAGGGGRAREGH
jgi:hypothetical protein